MEKTFILTSNLQSSLNQATGDITNLLQPGFPETPN